MKNDFAKDLHSLLTFWNAVKAEATARFPHKTELEIDAIVARVANERLGF